MRQEIVRLFMAMAVEVRENQSHASHKSEEIGQPAAGRDAVEGTEGNKSRQDLTAGIYAGNPGIFELALGAGAEQIRQMQLVEQGVVKYLILDAHTLPVRLL